MFKLAAKDKRDVRLDKANQNMILLTPNENRANTTSVRMD
jgi:hypothetical protein